MADIKIYIATHKEYKMPEQDIYVPIWAGAEINPNYKGQYQGDNVGDNISFKNSNYNELTVLYWAWRNSQADIKGLVHYRRYIGEIGIRSNTLNEILKKKEICQCL